MQVKLTKTEIRKLPKCVWDRIHDAGYREPTWEDVKYQCESGIALIQEGEWYKGREPAYFWPKFKKWLAVAEEKLKE